MRTGTVITGIGILLLATSFTGTGPTAKEIIKKAEDNLRGTTSTSEMTIDVVRPQWKRTMKLKSWSKGTQYSMTLITAPAEDQGTVFLKRDKEIWNWVPSVERVIKLPPSMMMQSWMGTDFTNDDLVKASSKTDDYTQKIINDTAVVEQRKCWKIELIPLPAAGVVWSKVNIWVDQADYLELRSEYYDEDSTLTMVFKASDIRKMGGRTIPAKIEVIPAGKKGQETILTYNSITFDQPISDDFFTTQNMKTVK